MSNLLQVILPVLFIILLWALIYTLNGLQLHLYDHHRSIWEQITIKRFFFFKREDFPALLFNFRVFSVVFSKDDLDDRVLRRYKYRVRVLFLTCVGFAFAASQYLF